jgi:hypothetical protein
MVLNPFLIKVLSMLQLAITSNVKEARQWLIQYFQSLRICHIYLELVPIMQLLVALQGISVYCNYPISNHSFGNSFTPFANATLIRILLKMQRFRTIILMPNSSKKLFLTTLIIQTSLLSSNENTIGYFPESMTSKLSLTIRLSVSSNVNYYLNVVSQEEYKVAIMLSR